MHRFTRRAIVLRGRRSSTLDPVLAQRATARAKASRAVRAALRMGKVAVLRTTRWDGLGWWLEDLAADLSCGTPSLYVARLDLGTVGKNDEAWANVLERVGDLLGAPARAHVAITHRDQFIQRARELWAASSRRGRPSVIVLEDADRVGANLIDDLMTAWFDVSRRVATTRMPRLLVTAKLGGVPIDTRRAVEHLLADPTEDEAASMLAELLGPSDPDRLHAVVDAVGPVPAFLAQLAMMGGPTEDAEIRQGLADLYEDLCEIVVRTLGQATVGDRLRALVVCSHATDERLDGILQRSGLVVTEGGVTSLRSPLLAQVIREID